VTITRTLRVGTRASALARTQTQHVIDALGVAVQIVPIVTHGDRSSASMAQIGGTGIFVAALREALLAGDPEPLRAFHRAAVALVSPKIGDWVPRWQAGALKAAELTGAHLKALADGDGSHLEQSGVRVATPSNPDGFGMCGRRAEYDIDQEGRQR